MSKEKKGKITYAEPSNYFPKYIRDEVEREEAERKAKERKARTTKEGDCVDERQ